MYYFIALLTVFCLIYTSVLAVYRLYFAPLAGFPGHRLAAATGWYEFWYDFVLGGKYIFEIEKMHKKYGPIIRVNPHELQINDPEFYNEIYVTESKRKTNNYEVFIKGIDFDGSHLLTTDHDLHKRRRKPLEPFFSRMGITRLQPLLADVVRKFESRLMEIEGSGAVIRLDHAFSALSGDIIGKICWENPGSFLDDSEFAPAWYNLIHMIVRSIPLMTGFPFLVHIASYVPEKILLWIFPEGQAFNKFKEIALLRIHEAKQEKLDEELRGFSTAEHVTLFRYIVHSDMPLSELSNERLAKEAQVLLGGGTASTARTLSFLSYYVLSNSGMRRRLQDELRIPMINWPTTIPSWAELEKLPYLQALIKEALRLSYGVVHRLPRCFPETTIQYQQWKIPAGSPVGMSAYLMHSNPNIYPEPETFNPERWLGEIDPAMNKSFVPFCRGSRNCLGMNLAHAEMSLCVAILFRPGGPSSRLYETDESDVKQAHDFLIPLPKLDTKGVRVKIC